MRPVDRVDDDGWDARDTVDAVASVFTEDGADIIYEAIEDEAVQGIHRHDTSVVDGEVRFRNNFPVLDPGSAEAFVDGEEEAVRTVYEELIHWRQIDDVRSSGLEVAEWQLLQPLHEAQATYNVDGAEMQEEDPFVALYDDILASEAGGELLEAFSEERYLGTITVDVTYEVQHVEGIDVVSASFEQLFVDERSAYDGFDACVDAVYETMEETVIADYVDDLEAMGDAVTVVGQEVTVDALDYRDDDVDTERLVKHLERVQEEIEDGYRRAETEGHCVPAGAPTSGRDEPGRW